MVRSWLVALTLSLAAPAWGDDIAASERQRLSAEMVRLAQRNAWSGVERAYLGIVELGLEPSREQHLLGADSARDRGDVLNMIVRYEEALAVEPSDEVIARRDAALAAFGKVKLTAPPGTAFSVAEPPFLPDRVAAVDFAASTLARDGHFDGFLPVGSYTLGDTTFDVAAHSEAIVVDLGEGPPVADSFTERAGVRFPMKATLGGRKVVLNGIGLRQKAYIDVYVAALYMDVGTTKARVAITRDAPKRIVMHFIHKRVSERVLVTHWRAAFEAQPNAGALTSRLDKLVEVMEDMHAGEQIVFDYLPSKGTVVSVKGKRRAVIKGTDFMEVLWGVWLGDSPPSQRMKRDMLGGS